MMSQYYNRQENDDVAHALKLSFRPGADARGSGSGSDSDFASPRSTNTDLNNAVTWYTASDDGPIQNLNPIDEASEETTAEVALLLTSVADIASREINNRSSALSTLPAKSLPCFPDLSHSLPSDSPERNKNRNDDSGSDDNRMDYETNQAQIIGNGNGNGANNSVNLFPALLHFDHKKTRAVSMDTDDYDPNLPALMKWRVKGESMSPTSSPGHQHHHGIFSTPPPSPVVKKRGSEFLQGSLSEHRRSFTGGGCKMPKKGRGLRPRSVSLAEGTATHVFMPEVKVEIGALVNPLSNGNEQQIQPADATAATKQMKVILRKKFSWKNFPELEAFLIANREEYLRHSTLNYTMQQKEYNNRLTERMIQLAAHNGYVFDDTDFSFVTVRDRIRCYFKSYVQSMKKRGVVIGYAARKAGLVSEQELEESAHTSGKIYVPLGDPK